MARGPSWWRARSKAGPQLPSSLEHDTRAHCGTRKRASTAAANQDAQRRALQRGLPRFSTANLAGVLTEEWSLGDAGECPLPVRSTPRSNVRHGRDPDPAEAVDIRPLFRPTRLFSVAQGGRRVTVVASEIGLLREDQDVVHLDPELPDGGFQLPMTRSWQDPRRAS